MSTRLARVREIWDAMSRDAIEGSEALFAIAAPDCVFRPAVDRDREFEGVEEVRAYLREFLQKDTRMELRAHEITENEAENTVVIEGDVRLHRPEGSFADSTVRWVYEFDEADRIVRATST